MRLVLLLTVWASPGWAAGVPTALVCERAIGAAEERAHTAPGLLHAIGLVESGRADGHRERRPWPWTVTAEGVGTFYGTKDDAIAAVVALQGRGVTSIDVGCMQVNLQFHPGAFASLDEAFEPGRNVAYATRFLTGLYGRLGNWGAAAAAYHSQTPALAAEYGKLIAAVWAGAPVPVVQASDGVEVLRLPGGGQMRVFRSAEAGGHRRVFGVLE